MIDDIDEDRKFERLESQVYYWASRALECGETDNLVEAKKALEKMRVAMLDQRVAHVEAMARRLFESYARGLTPPNPEYVPDTAAHARRLDAEIERMRARARLCAERYYADEIGGAP
jgi:hypothetical protein